MTLSKKYRDFIDGYMRHGNGAKAARDCGYTGNRPDQAAYEYLRKPEIKQEIERRTTLIVGQPEVVQRIAERSRTTIADVLHIQELPPPAPPSEDADDTEDEGERERPMYDGRLWTLDLIKAKETGAIHQIRKLKRGKYGDELEMYDPLPALEVLAKYLKLFGSESNGILKYLDLSKLTKEQLQRLADGEDAIAVLLSTTTDPGTSGAGAA